MSEKITRSAYWQQLQAKCQAVVVRIDGVVGYGLFDLTSKESFYHLPDAVFAIGSSIKIPVLMALFKAQHQGKLTLDQRVIFDTSQKVGGSGVLQSLDNPVEMTLRDMANLMIVLSDNSATNICIKHVGFDYVNDMLDELGLRETRLRRLMIDSKAALQDRENVSTPTELVKMMSILYQGQFISQEICEQILAILRKPKTGPLYTALPAGTRIANKPGGLEGVRCDVGVIELPNRPFVFAVVGNYLHNPDNPEIPELIKLVYRHQLQLSNSTAFGRQLPIELFIS